MSDTCELGCHVEDTPSAGPASRHYRVGSSPCEAARLRQSALQRIRYQDPLWRVRQIPDPVTWPAECELGCHVEFDALGQSQGPYQRHVRREIPPCEMSLALYRSQASKYRRNAGWTCLLYTSPSPRDS